METFSALLALCVGGRWITITKARDARLWCFLWYAIEKNSWVNNGNAGDLRRHRAHYDVTVMKLTQNWYNIPSVNIDLPPCVVNYANPIYGVATICHRVRCLRWGHPSLFHTATSLLIWYTMFCMRDTSYRLIWLKFINMRSVYAQSGTHSRFNWWIIAVLT